MIEEIRYIYGKTQYMNEKTQYIYRKTQYMNGKTRVFGIVSLL